MFRYARFLPFTQQESDAGFYRVLAPLRAKLLRARSGGEATGALNDAKHRLLSATQCMLSSRVAVKALVVKLQNAMLENWQFQRRARVLAGGPMGLVVDPSNSCQLACPGCVHSPTAKAHFEWKAGLLARERLNTFLSQYGPTATHLTLYNYGEPLVNPQTPAFVAEAKRYLLRTSLSTNLSLTRFDAEAYIESGLDFFVCSIDGATQPVYERFRRNGNLELVLENLRRLVMARECSGKTSPVIVWRYLVFEHNRREVPLAESMAQELGVDEFRAEAGWDVSWDDAAVRVTDFVPVCRQYRDVFQRLNSWKTDTNTAADAFDEAFARAWAVAEEEPRGEPAKSCEWLYKSITMDAGGRIMPCCCSPRRDGELHFDQFPSTDVFNSARHQQARAWFAGERRDSARSLFCSRCEFDKRADPSAAQLKSYFAAIKPELFTERTLDLLSTDL